MGVMAERNKFGKGKVTCYIETADSGRVTLTANGIPCESGQIEKMSEDSGDRPIKISIQFGAVLNCRRTKRKGSRLLHTPRCCYGTASEHFWHRFPLRDVWWVTTIWFCSFFDDDDGEDREEFRALI